MKKTGLTLFLMFILSVSLFAQNEWDAVLDRYEEICRSCIELRETISRGENVPAERVSSLMKELNAIRARLKSTNSSMTAGQKDRYNRIKARYTSRFAADTTSEDINRRETSLSPITVSLSIPDCKSEKIQKPVDATFESAPVTREKFHASVSAVCLISDNLQYGLSAAVRKGRYGGYISALSDFSDRSHSYACNSAGKIEGGGLFWGDGTTRSGHATLTVGPSCRLTPVWEISAGAGCSFEHTYWRDVTGKWAKVSDLSPVSPCLEAGGAFIYHNFRIGAGAGVVVSSGTCHLKLAIGFELP